MTSTTSTSRTATSERVRLDRSQRAAFTLVELLVVLIIIGMISGVAVLSWQALVPNQQLNTAVRNLSEVIYGTRSEAIARNREFQIHYDLDNDAYRVRTPYRVGGGFAVADDEERLWINATNLAKEGISIREITIDEQTYADGQVLVRFDPLGASSGHTIVLQQEIFDRILTIEVLPLTGEIRFHDGYFEREPAAEEDFR